MTNPAAARRTLRALPAKQASDALVAIFDLLCPSADTRGAPKSWAADPEERYAFIATSLIHGRVPGTRHRARSRPASRSLAARLAGVGRLAQAQRA